ncbi:uncharacterized protein N7469_003521 [Penicillium citrinum]|uniref:Uncharacterized protein n=2 Tax=Penicillium TaxID=5073 RepID=A0A9W9TQB3_PENCI|nr:uncharacterized protein N7469_003521 [Penicillium citrinum]KAJ5234353.1 hypothetical protein N7469_003521 [Penicillium citrinum]KAJ5589963.1 hypothetical protein N7450_003935 [Penicillium hetheringtonii]
MHSAETSFLVGLEGTEITTTARPAFQLPTKTWIIIKRLGEVSMFTYQMNTDGGIPPGFSAGRFLYYSKDDSTKEPAFMRVYYQIPIYGTEWSSHNVRASQAVPPIELVELKAFRSFIKHACSAVPQLLGYHEGQQPDDGIVPGGYTTMIVWEKVPGIPLSKEYFWNLDRVQRDGILGNFRRLTRCGVQPFASSFSKLIYDESTGKISKNPGNSRLNANSYIQSHIPGFCMAVPIDSARTWTDRIYLEYGMVKAPHTQHRYDHEEEWEF